MWKMACAWGIVVALAVPVTRAAARDAVAAREEDLTLPWSVSEPTYASDPLSSRAMYPKPGTQKPAGQRTFKTVVLENRYVRVQVVPELGGVVARAIYKPTGDDLFYFEGKAKDWLPGWESGVKVSFPYPEHGLGMDQPAGYRIVQGADGSAMVAMWMEFARFNQPYQRGRCGRYSNMMLSQQVMLEPEQSTFSVRYRIVNPAPYKQGRRIWNTTYFPRAQTESGAVQGEQRPPDRYGTQWIFPAAWVSDRGGELLRRYDAAAMVLFGQKGAGLFAWNIRHGFAGLWYPEAKISRLRLTNPDYAPGAGQWFMDDGAFDAAISSCRYNCCELWGGTDNLVDGPQGWIGPGESFSLYYRYALVKGIGKVMYAGKSAAAHVDLAGGHPFAEVATFTPVEQLSATWDGKAISGPAACSPDKPARFDLPAGTTGGQLKLMAGDAVVMDCRFPLDVPDDTAGHARIKAAIKAGPLNSELRGSADEQGQTYQKAIIGYPEGSADRGRVLLRDGRLDEAIACLKQATEADGNDGEAWHLLGAAMLEKGDREKASEAFADAMQAKRPFAPAAYFLALDEIAAKRDNRAEMMLNDLAKAQPLHWEGRLLQAWLQAMGPKTAVRSVALARMLEQEDPADPRVQFILAKGLAHIGDADGAAKSEAVLGTLMKEPGAKARLAEFEAATNGQYVVAERLATGAPGMPKAEIRMPKE